MNLLSILLAVMTSKAALGQVSGKTGLSQKQIKKLMMIAIPIGPTPGIFSALLGSSPSAAAPEPEQNDSINGVALLQALLNARK